MNPEPDNLGYFTASCIGALGALALVAAGWRAVDAALRRVQPRKPGPR